MAISAFGAVVSFLTGVVSTVVLISLRKLHESIEGTKEEIYSPLYDEFAEIADNGLQIPNRVGDGIFTTEWDNFEPSEKIRVDEDLRDELSEYYNKINGLEVLLENTNRELLSNAEETDLLRKADNQYHFLPANHEGRISQRQLIRPYEWLRRYGDILIKSDETEDLFENMRALDKRSNVGPKSTHFWSKEHYKLIWDSFKDVEEEWLDTQQFSNTDELILEIENQAEEIRDRLSEKLDSSWLNPRF